MVESLYQAVDYYSMSLIKTEWEKIAKRVRDTGVDFRGAQEAYFGISSISQELLEVMIKLLQTVVEEIIKVAVETEEDKKRITQLESALYEKYKFDRIIGKSEALQNIFKLLGKVIESESPVLIEGETGTGKELVAKTVHYNGPRKDGPWNAVNCSAFAEPLLESEFFGHVKGAFTGAISDKPGVFEVTHRGTLFLDEVAEMPPPLQVKLLRVLQEGIFTPVGSTQSRQVDVRIISATNKNLKELVNQGKFREDLYYRINVIKVSLPSLRSRSEDIPLFIDHFIRTSESGRKKKITSVRSDALKCLLDYSWPGNVRELQNVLARAISLASSPNITVEDLPEEIAKQEKGLSSSIDSGRPYEEQKENFHKEYLSQLLVRSKGNVTKAARIAGLHRSTLQDFFKKYGIKASSFKA